ncbi:hypothetical protein P7K49_030975 [Saguinus oedipus]|uniref:Uncharacterized protein n=1 Tax=Saguinus oedipus TaxID=9490 RepID=A0ABQ9U3U0_SAGOE|nr:hypothetical protein P7K49_030975 [Saguinus oedipus]
MQLTSLPNSKQLVWLTTTPGMSKLTMSGEEPPGNTGWHVRLSAAKCGLAQGPRREAANWTLNTGPRHHGLDGMGDHPVSTQAASAHQAAALNPGSDDDQTLSEHPGTAPAQQDAGVRAAVAPEAGRALATALSGKTQSQVMPGASSQKGEATGPCGLAYVTPSGLKLAMIPAAMLPQEQRPHGPQTGSAYRLIVRSEALGVTIGDITVADPRGSDSSLKLPWAREWLQSQEHMARAGQLLSSTHPDGSIHIRILHGRDLSLFRFWKQNRCQK